MEDSSASWNSQESSSTLVETSTLVPGFGDEVVLFVLFLVSSVVIIFFLSRRRTANRGSDPPGVVEEERNEDIIDQGRSDNITEDITEQRLDGVEREGIRHRYSHNVDHQPRQHSQRDGNTDGVSDRNTGDGIDRSTGGDHSTGEGGDHSTGDSGDVGAGDSGDHSAGDSGDHYNRISVKLVSLTATQTIIVNKTITLQELAQTYFRTELHEGRRIRFIYQGHILNDFNVSLDDYGIGNNTSLHVHVGQQPAARADVRQTEDDGVAIDLSGLFLPLFGLMLGIVWMTFLMWPHVFSFLTKLMLFFLSIGYIFLVYSMRFS